MEFMNTAQKAAEINNTRDRKNGRLNEMIKNDVQNKSVKNA